MITETPNINYFQDFYYQTQRIKKECFIDFKNDFLRAFWNFKKFNRGILELEDIALWISSASLSYCELILNMERRTPIRFKFLLKRHIKALFYHFQKQDPTNQMFYQYIFHEKNLFQNPLTEKLCLLNQSDKKD
jgi:hypothetical protein